MTAQNPKKPVSSGNKTNPDLSVQRNMPFSEIRENMMIMKDGSSRMVLKVHALNFNLKSIEEQDAILISYQRFLNSLNFPIQIIIRSLRVDIESYIHKLKTLAIKQENSLLQEQTYKYIDFLLTLIDMAQIMKKEFYIVVPFDETNNESVRKVGMVGWFQNFWSAISQSQSVSDIRANRQKANRLYKGNSERIASIKMSLENIGLRAEELKKDELIKLLYNYYNPRVSSENIIRDSVDNFNVQ